MATSATAWVIDACNGRKNKFPRPQNETGGPEGPPGYEGEARDVKNRAPATSKPASDHPVTIARAVNLIMRAVNEAEAGNTDTDRVKDTAFEVIGELVRAIHEERDGGKE